jgi:hypothetical protein
LPACPYHYKVNGSQLTDGKLSIFRTPTPSLTWWPYIEAHARYWPRAAIMSQSIPPVLTGKAALRSTVLTSTWLKSHSGWRPGSASGNSQDYEIPRTNRYIRSHPIWLNTFVMAPTTCDFTQLTLCACPYHYSVFDSRDRRAPDLRCKAW